MGSSAGVSRSKLTAVKMGSCLWLWCGRTRSLSRCKPALPGPQPGSWGPWALGLLEVLAYSHSRRGGPRQLPGAAPAGALQFVSLLRHPSLLDLLLGAEVPGADLDQSQPLRHEADAGELRGTSALLSALLTVTAPAQLAGMVPSGRDDEPWAQGKRRVKAWRGAAKVRGSGGGLREIQAGGGCASFFGLVGASWEPRCRRRTSGPTPPAGPRPRARSSSSPCLTECRVVVGNIDEDVVLFCSSVAPVAVRGQPWWWPGPHGGAAAGGGGWGGTPRFEPRFLFTPPQKRQADVF